MAVVDKKTEVDVNGKPAVEAEQVQEVPARPNRDAYQKMFAEDYPDVNFDDKEARYGKMVEDRKRYKQLSESGRKLSGTLGKHRWMAAMWQDLSEDEEGALDPFTWMAKNGVDIQRAIEDEEYRKQINQYLSEWQQKQEENEAVNSEREENLKSSGQALDDLSRELNLSDEQCDRLWEHMFKEVIVPGWFGEVSKDTWKMALHAMNYDQDIANAREESAMQARNEKHANKVKNFNDSKVPPSFSQGRGQRATPAPKKSNGMMGFDEMKKYGY